MMDENSGEISIIRNDVPFYDTAYGALVTYPVPVGEISKAKETQQKYNYQAGRIPEAEDRHEFIS